MIKTNPSNVIVQHISEATLRTYFVGYNSGIFKYEELIEKILDSIVDFAFGFHEGIYNSQIKEDVRKAAKLIYKIEKYDKSNPKHKKKTTKGRVDYKDEEDFKKSKYYSRGEFGELILHLLLRDFMNTVPLISKIFFRDSLGTPIKGIDAVHIGPSLSDKNKHSLYLGESKLHHTGDSGVKELIEDIENHFNHDFLEGEFLLIGNKKISFVHIDEYTNKETLEEYTKYLALKNSWFKKIDEVNKNKGQLTTLFDSITIPMLCTYSSSAISSNTNEKAKKFKEEYDKEIRKLENIFEIGLQKLKTKSKLVNSNLNVVLLLFPIPNKEELVKRLHEKLHEKQTT